jgi:septum formation protein
MKCLVKKDSLVIQKLRILLGSKSPRRSQLLGAAGFEFEVVTSDADEAYPLDLAVEEVAAYIARNKAAGLLHRLDEDVLIITADTIVVLDGVVYGKPTDVQDAHRILGCIAGRKHTVYTGVHIASKGRSYTFTEATDVYIQPMTEAEIGYYVLNYAPFDKAGAYAIQEWIGVTKIGRMDGSYTNVMGLPMSRLYEVLVTEFGVFG